MHQINATQWWFFTICFCHLFSTSSFSLYLYIDSVARDWHFEFRILPTHQCEICSIDIPFQCYARRHRFFLILVVVVIHWVTIYFEWKFLTVFSILFLAKGGFYENSWQFLINSCAISNCRIFIETMRIGIKTNDPGASSVQHMDKSSQLKSPMAKKHKTELQKFQSDFKCASLLLSIVKFHAINL